MIPHNIEVCPPQDRAGPFLRASVGSLPRGGSCCHHDGGGGRHRQSQTGAGEPIQQPTGCDRRHWGVVPEVGQEEH